LGVKVLVIRFSSIGDIVLTTPVLRGLHQQLDAEVHVLTKQSFVPLLANNPNVTRVHVLDPDWHAMIRSLRAEGFSHVVDLHHNLRTMRVKAALGKPSSAFRKLNLEKWMLVNLGIDRLPDRHIVDRYWDAVTGLGVSPDGEGLDLVIPPGKEVDLEAWGLLPGRYACVAVGAAHATKCMTDRQIAGVVRALAMPVVLLGGPGDKEKAASIKRMVGTEQAIDACGLVDILGSASFLQQAGPVVNHDSGLMHIAAALRKPQVVVWGNTVPAFGMGPYYGSHTVRHESFERAGLRCRPCSKIGYDACPKGHFRCMLEHDPVRIAEAAVRLTIGEPED